MKQPRSILITGASSGIGAALASAYARPGVRLALTARNADRLARVAEACRTAGAEVSYEPLDITDGRALADWIATVEQAQPLELLIVNAGMTGGNRPDRIGEDLGALRRIMAVNFDGACATLHAALPALRRRGRGQIALTSSIAGFRGLPYSPAYCASKAALTAYGEALRAWLRPDGVEVSVILPGFVETRLSGHVDGPKPLMMTVDRAARIIKRGLERGQARIAFPLSLYIGMRLLAALPSRIVDPILGRVAVDIRRYE
jgi:short-subunit dehydrogenase